MTSFLYWLYLWQNKEYRWDRMRLHLAQLHPNTLMRIILVGQRRRPRFTKKIIFIASISLSLALVVTVAFMSFYIAWPIAVLLTYFLLPFIVGLTVGFMAFPSNMITAIVATMARVKREKFSELLVIGVTGSYGKTSTKDAIASVLSQKYVVLKTPGGVNTKLGISLQILRQLSRKHQIYVVEMGAYKVGEIAELVSITKPQLAVLTGINEQHLGLFGSIESTIEAKFELPAGIPDDGYAFINIADQNVASNKDRIVASTIEYSSTKPEENANAARAVGAYFGLTEEEIEVGLSKLAQSTSRLQVHKLDNGLIVVDDTYSSNPTGFKAAIDKSLSFGRPIVWAVVTGVYDLGKESRSINTELSRYAQSNGVNVLIVEAMHAAYYQEAYLLSDHKEFFAELAKMDPSKMVILLEGNQRVINKIKEKLL